MAVVNYKCPNCGAKVNKETCKCEYCGSVLEFKSDSKIGESVDNIISHIGKELNSLGNSLNKTFDNFFGSKSNKK